MNSNLSVCPPSTSSITQTLSEDYTWPSKKAKNAGTDVLLNLGSVKNGRKCRNSRSAQPRFRQKWPKMREPTFFATSAPSKKAKNAGNDVLRILVSGKNGQKCRNSRSAQPRFRQKWPKMLELTFCATSVPSKMAENAGTEGRQGARAAISGATGGAHHVKQRDKALAPR